MCHCAKWHLNGKAKIAGDFGSPEGKSFGFDDMKYLWNRGHWKFIKECNNGKLEAYDYSNGIEMSANSTDIKFTTDFLTDRAIDYINKRVSLTSCSDKIICTSKSPFMLMLSYPDPHPPNDVREPYSKMFNHMTFNLPQSAIKALMNNSTMPEWSFGQKATVHFTKVHNISEQIAKCKTYQNAQRKIFGMVKLIDDSVGRILKAIQEQGIENNTIVIFTSDHGNTMGEHNQQGKNTPYKTSSGTPMIIRWPHRIKAGKVIEPAYSSLDFAPTLLNLLNIKDFKNESFGFYGFDASDHLLSLDLQVSDEEQTRFIYSYRNKFVSAVTQRYQLVLGTNSVHPWIFDKHLDPDETINFYSEITNNMSTTYGRIYSQMKDKIVAEVNKHRFITKEMFNL